MRETLGCSLDLNLIRYVKVSLGGGNPHPSTFPFAGMTLRLKDGACLEVSEGDMARALQYSATAGLPDLVAWLKELQRTSHGRTIDSFDLCIGGGSQEVLTKALEMLLNDGDPILIEAPAYSGTLAFLRPLGCQLIGRDLSRPMESDGF